jgi:hypothetical protein
MPWGEYYREALEQQMKPWLAKLYGFHLLKIGNLSAEINTESCAISHQVNVSRRIAGSGEGRPAAFCRLPKNPLMRACWRIRCRGAAIRIVCCGSRSRAD